MRLLLPLLESFLSTAFAAAHRQALPEKLECHLSTAFAAAHVQYIGSQRDGKFINRLRGGTHTQSHSVPLPFFINRLRGGTRYCYLRSRITIIYQPPSRRHTRRSLCWLRRLHLSTAFAAAHQSSLFDGSGFVLSTAFAAAHEIHRLSRDGFFLSTAFAAAH